MEINNYKTAAEPKGNAGGVPVFCAHDKTMALTKLRPNPKNPNKHSKEQISLLAKIIKATGWRAPITISAQSGYIVKGHGRYMAAMAAGLTEVPVDVQSYASEAEEYADLVADNRISELSEIEDKALANIFLDLDLETIPAELTGYTEDEMSNILAALNDGIEEMQEDVDSLPDTPPKIVTLNGDIWILGRHRVMCGDCTNEENRRILFNGAEPEILLTDPPYCSGGFQEAGKSVGSKGSTAKSEANCFIANDTLSTRGYQQLIKSILTNVPVKICYIFTDWRMWIYLFDMVEGSGYGVKNMLVWNKKTPGMGVGWRTQHELIMLALKTKPKWDNHKGYGNVLDCTRQANELHPTQKPVELIAKLLDNTSWANGVFEPFCGSGTTLIACEQAKQTCYGMELEGRHVDTIVKRYLAVSGNDNIKLIRNGVEQPLEVYAPLLMVDEK